MGNHDNVEGHCYGFEVLNMDTSEADIPEKSSPDPDKKGCNFFGKRFMKDFFSSWYRPKWLPGILRRRKLNEDNPEDNHGNCCRNNVNNMSVLENNTCDSESSLIGHQSPRRHSSPRVVRAIISGNCYSRDSNCNYSNGNKPLCLVDDRGCVMSKSTQTRHVTWQCSECSTSSSYESAIIGEAHGIVTDMLADSNLPTHVVSGLKTISNLLKPPENHVTSHKPKVSPLVSLSEASNYGSDSEDLPYTGERPTSLPKRLRRSLPPSLIRRMSTSTWTTTTSATGLPTLETEPCRNRSSSFRHSRDSTPSASPSGSRSNSPSPNSPTPVSLTIPKSRSFSLANVPTSSNQKRAMRERRSLQNVSSSNITNEGYSPVKDKVVSLLSKNEHDSVKDGHQVATAALTKRFNITSDYESSDSPSSSDHSDHIVSAEERTSRPPGGARTPAGVEKEYITRDNNSNQSEQATTVTTVTSSHSNHQHTPTNAHTSVATGKITNKVTAVETSTEVVTSTGDKFPYDLDSYRDHALLEISALSQWDYPVFDLADQAHKTILSLVSYRLFLETGLFDTFRIPLPEFMNYFHALELGYREKPYHNRIHATDVLHGVYYLTSQAIPGFTKVSLEGEKPQSSSESECEFERCGDVSEEETYGVMCRNFPPLELMALYTAAAMHDYDHPGRTNAFLVTTNAPLAVLYNDRSVLESHHAASAWQLFLANPAHNWLRYLDKGEFKRFRFLVIECILATDLKRHFELLAEFNAKVNDEDAPGIDWTSEADRLMVANMVIKMADINGPAKRKDLHVRWTDSISEEFYEQGDEEQNLGLPISPYMDRKNPQLAKLQESFINHLVAPLCNALGGAGLLPGTWVSEPASKLAASGGDSSCPEDDTDPEPKVEREIHCWLTKHLQDNHEMWVKVLKEEAAQKEKEEKEKKKTEGIEEMEPIKEEDTPPDSASSTSKDASQTLPSPKTTPQNSTQTTPKHSKTDSQSTDRGTNQSSVQGQQSTDGGANQSSVQGQLTSPSLQPPANQTSQSDTLLQKDQSETVLQSTQNQSQTLIKESKDSQSESLKQTDKSEIDR